jgi:two-component system phosphate regulon sensor histidine kinase PhoR
MLSSRLFWKLLLASAGLNLLAAVAFGVILSNWQERQLIEQIDRRLRDAALLVRGEMGSQLAAGASEGLQHEICHLGKITGTRFTLINTQGAVLADSEKESLAEAQAMDNHGDRPEVVQARLRGEGSSLRPSVSLQEPFRYFALRADADDRPIGFVRSSLAEAPVRAQVAAARRLIWSLVAVIFCCELALLYWIVGRVVHPVGALTEAAAAIASGDYQHRVYVPNRDELGTLAQTFNRMSQDLHVRMAQLGESHERHATVLGGMIEGVIAVDARQRIVLANKAAGRLFDFRPASAEGRPLLEVVRSHALDQAVSEALTSRMSQRLEMGGSGLDKLTADIHVTPLAGDPCPGAVLVMHNTTELRRLESLRRDFVANVSHELKTPLSSIKACAETLRNGALSDPEATQRFLARIEEQSDRLHHLIIDMLSLARIESGQQAFDIGPVELSQVAAACVDGYRQAAEAKQIRLFVEPDLPQCRVHAEEEGFREILDNLVDNAIKYTHEGGTVAIRWQIDGNWARIDVADTGIGISEKDRPRVFERFYRVDRARSRELGGTGLGLSIVKHLAQSFGGSVSVESEPGVGSTFSVDLQIF